jgi:hypothetical protein
VLDALEDATSAGISTVTAPSVIGTRLKLNVAPVPVNPLIVALATCGLVDANPFTDSEKVVVIGIMAAFVVEALVLVRTTVGPPTAADAMVASPLTPKTTARDASIAITRDCANLI